MGARSDHGKQSVSYKATRSLSIYTIPVGSREEVNQKHIAPNDIHTIESITALATDMIGRESNRRRQLRPSVSQTNSIDTSRLLPPLSIDFTEWTSASMKKMRREL